MPDLNLEIEIIIKQIMPDGTIVAQKVSTITIDSAIQWLGQMDRMMLREAAETEIAESLADKEGEE